MVFNCSRRRFHFAMKPNQRKKGSSNCRKNKGRGSGARCQPAAAVSTSASSVRGAGGRPDVAAAAAAATAAALTPAVPVAAACGADDRGSPEVLKSKMEFSSSFRFPFEMNMLMYSHPALKNVILGGINSIQREAQLRGIPLLEKDGFLIDYDRYNFVMWYITTLSREEYTWKDHLIKNTIQSSLYHVAVKVLRHRFGPALKRLKSKFLSGVAAGDVDPLLESDQSAELSHIERFWLFPYILLSQSDDEHCAYREKLTNPATPEVMEKIYDDYMCYNADLDGVLSECFLSAFDEEVDG